MTSLALLTRAELEWIVESADACEGVLFWWKQSIGWQIVIMPSSLWRFGRRSA